MEPENLNHNTPILPSRHDPEDRNGDNYSRQYTDGPLQDLPAPVEAKRLYGRRAITKYADYLPMPRPRDEQGNVVPRTFVHDHPLPDGEQLAEDYTEALKLIRRVSPLRAAILMDYLHRARTAQSRLRQLLREEEEQHHNYNEEVRGADAWIDKRINDLRSERDKVAERYDEEVAGLIEKRAEARKRAVVACAKAGLPVYGKQWPGEEVEEKEKEAEGPAPGVPSEPESSTVVAAPVTEVAKPERSEASPVARVLKIFQRKPSAVTEVSEVVSAPPPEASTEVFSASNTSSREPFRVPEPLRISFPLDEAREQAAPEEAIAVDQGILLSSPAHENMHLEWHKLWHLGLKFTQTLALLTCGAVFGVSLGMILKVADVQMFSYAPAKVILPFLIVGLLGGSLFWVLGRVIGGLAGLVSEERHVALMARHPNDPAEIGRWMRKTAIVSFVAFVFVMVSLIAIEACVEREGIVKSFEDSMRLMRIGTGNTQAVSQGLSPMAVLGLVLMVSVPFAYLHAVEGWVEARKRVFTHYVKARREKDAWHIARAMYDERLADAKAAIAHEAERAEQERQAAKRRAEEERQYRRQREEEERTREQAMRDVIDGVFLPQDTASLPDEQPVASEPPRIPDEQSTPPGTTSVAKSMRLPILVPTLEQRAEVAVSEQEAREAHDRLAEARARRRDALVWYEQRMVELEQERKRENPVLHLTARQRIEDGYNEYVGAVKTFDDAFDKERERVERLLRGGWYFILRDSLFRRPITADVETERHLM